MSTTFSTEVPFLTRMANKLPNVDTEVMSNVSFRGEIAYLMSRTPKGTALNGEATTYVDDFEGAQSNIDLRDALSWSLSSVPAANVSGAEAPIDDLSAGHHRARMAWYTIDPIFYSSRRPSEISKSVYQRNFSTTRLDTRSNFCSVHYGSCLLSERKRTLQ
jgi:cell surface protein SprA